MSKETFHRTLDTLKKQLGAISQRPEAFNQYLWHLSDRAQILDKIREIVEGSRKMIYLSVWKEELQEVEPQINVAFGKKWERLRNVMVKEAKTVRLSPERQSGKRGKNTIYPSTQGKT